MKIRRKSKPFRQFTKTPTKDSTIEDYPKLTNSAKDWSL
jgi:hypothetical protein